MTNPTTARDPFIHSLRPPAFHRTWNGREPARVVTTRAADLPGLVALPVRALMPDLPEPIWAEDPLLGTTDVSTVRAQTRQRVAAMDWSMIARGKTVNLVANPHGFQLAGEAYVAMLEEIAGHVRATRDAKIRLRIAESMGHIENPDWVTIYKLKARFGDVQECPQIGAGSRLATRLGEMWVTKKLFDAPYFIHTHVTEMREGYLHRMLDRLLKPFGMAYARLETRSAYHFGYGPRTGQMVSRAIFESDFIQRRYTGTVVLDTTSEGVVGVHGDNDLMALDRRLAVNVLRNYGTLMRLLGEIEDCVVVFDDHGCGVYTYAGGIAFDNLLCADTDFLDLDNLALLSVETHNKDNNGLTMGKNEAIKGIVINYMAGGVPQQFLWDNYPLHVVGEQVYRWLSNDPSNTYIENSARRHADLQGAIATACREGGSDNLIIYDRTPGAFRVSEALGRHLLARAPAVAAAVENHYLPKWLAQRDLL
jgi:hypothetical protein